MKKLGLLFIAVFIISFNGVSQSYFAVTDGLWSDPFTWSSTQGGAPNTGAGNGFPEAGSNAFTDGYQVFVDQDVTVANLAVRSTNRAGTQLNFGGLFDPLIITITGGLIGVSPALAGQSPTESVIEDTPGLIFRLTSTSALGAIRNWSYLAPLNTVEVSSAGTVITPNNAGGSVAITESLSVLSGIFQPRRNLADNSGAATITINAGTTLDLTNASGASITGSGGVLGTKFNNIQISGTVNVGTANSLSTENITMSATGVLSVAFNGANQQQGWWYQAATPSGVTLNAASTVSYSSNTVQNIYALTYGNLSLSSTSVVTKTLVGSGLTILGNLTVGANVTFSPASQVDFIGTAAQSISGTGTLNFNGGIELNKSSGTVTVNKAVTTGSIVVTAGTLSLGDVATSLNGTTVSNSGTITSGTAGSLLVAGPTIFSGSGSTTLNNLTVSSGSVGFNNPVSITGNVVNSGSLLFSSSSTLTFSGGSGQTISGNAFTVGNMVVNIGSTTLNNNANVELTGVLTMTNGTFDADGSGSGNLILNSDTNGDAAIGVMAGGMISGELTFERYFNNTTSNRWRNLALPVTGITYAELGSSITLSSNYLATYTEATLGNVDQGWTYINGGTLNSATGHTAWMVNNQPITISVKGPLLQQVPAESGSPYNFGVTYNDDSGQPASEDGWNFVPNPFASPIDWDNAGWVKTGVNAVVAVWDLEAGVYRYSGAGWDGVVAQGQSFWVQTNAAPILSCTESVKVTNSNPTFYRQSNEEVASRLFVSLKSALYEDNTMIQFKDESTEEFDGAFDAHKLKNEIFNLSTLTNEGVSLAVNVLPKTSCPSSVKLNITNIEQGSYKLTFEGLQTFANLRSMVLVDHFNGNTVPIEEGDTYSFEVTSDPKSFGSERFQITIKFTDQLPDPLIQKEESKLVSSYSEGNQWYMNDEPIEGATGKYFTPSLQGVYYVVVKNGSCTLSSESLMMNEGLARIFPNPVSTILKVDVQNLLPAGTSGEIFMYSSQGQLMRNEVFTDKDDVKEINVIGIKPGAYIVTLVSGSGIILEKSKVVIK